MQFNPACLSGNNNSTNVNQCAPPQQSQEFINNSTSFTDGSSTNGWNNNAIINSLPLYGIYNSSLIAVPQDAQQANDANANKKKVTPKRTPPPPTMRDDLSPKDDKNQGMDEEQKMKRQRRLLKNREAAQQFRQRQKEYIQNLERRVSELTSLVGESHKHIELLNTENRLLRDQLVYLYNVMRQNLSLTSSPTASPSINMNPITSSLMTSPAPAPSPGLIDLGMLGFKGFGVVDTGTSFEDMLKNNPNPSPLQLLVPPPLTPMTSPSITPSQSPMVSPMISPRIPNMGELNINKGMEMDCDVMTNPMLMTRFGGFVKTGDQSEAQTVPELMIKAEGTGNM